MVVFFLVTSISLAAILAFFLYSLNKLNAQLQSLEAKVDPLLIKAEGIFTLANEKIITLGERTEGILTHGEAVAEEVHDKIDRTATGVQRTVNAPIIGLNSIAVGLVQGLQTFRLLQQKQRMSGPIRFNQSQPAGHTAAPKAENAAILNDVPVALRAGGEH